MKIKTWLILSYFIVMALPIVALYIFYISLNKYDERQDLLEFMNLSSIEAEIGMQLDEPGLYHIQPLDNYTFIQELVDDNRKITLYREDGVVLYSSLSNSDWLNNNGVQRVYQNLNEIQKNHRTISIKRTVHDNDQLAGIYEISLSRDEWLEGVHNRTLVIGLLFGSTFLFIYLMVVILLNRKLNRPLKLLRSEMTAFANGKEGSDKRLRQSNDELGELINHFEGMKAQIIKGNAELNRQQKEKEYIVASLSHDLKTPLTVIRAYSEALQGKRKLTIKEEQEYTEILFEKLDYMKEMIDNLSVYTSLEASTEQHDFVQVDGEEYFEMMLAGYDEPCAKKGIGLSIIQDVHGEYLLQPLQMMRVMDNLMSNAIRYTPKGKKIWIAVISSSKRLPNWVFDPMLDEVEGWRKGGTIVILQNEGDAIFHDDLIRIFEPFVQLEANRGKGGSAGLGLSIAEKIVLLHGGKIRIWSKQDYGTLVAFWLKEESCNESE
ncbi:sensor histidine kinase [Cytobacillus horneckiae]|uniref:sensor histidine kinase n=1 Tax=Cytobacillus horneckiae TaxID=549687 RepID=UPI003D9AA507